METPQFVNKVKDKTNQLKHTIKTKGIIGIIEYIDPRLYEILTYKEKREANLSLGESSKRGKLAGYAHDKLTTLKETIYDYAACRQEEIKESIQGQVQGLAKQTDAFPQDLLEHIEEALSYKTLESDDDAVERKRFNTGDKVQRLVLDLGKLDARISWYVEMLNKLGLTIDEDLYIKDLVMITKVNDESDGIDQFTQEKKGKNRKIHSESKENRALEIWFQTQIIEILHDHKKQKIGQIVSSLQSK